MFVPKLAWLNWLLAHSSWLMKDMAVALAGGELLRLRDWPSKSAECGAGATPVSKQTRTRHQGKHVISRMNESPIVLSSERTKPIQL